MTFSRHTFHSNDFDMNTMKHEYDTFTLDIERFSFKRIISCIFTLESFITCVFTLVNIEPKNVILNELVLHIPICNISRL